jgi:uridine kinase
LKIIAISGGSGSGKTTLASHIFEKYSKSNLIISLDHYYFNQEQQMSRNGFCNYDHPLALDKDLLLKNIEELISNGETDIPQYCFKERNRIGYKSVNNVQTIIIEGLYSIEFLKNIEANKIFVEADIDLLLARRIERDMKHRGRNLESILEQYFKDVKPAYNKYIKNQKNVADLVIQNNYDKTEILLKEFDKLAKIYE